MYTLTTGWSFYHMEKQLVKGDRIFFRRHLTDTSRLLIDFERDDSSAATALRQRHYLPSSDPTSPATSLEVHGGANSADRDNPRPGKTSMVTSLGARKVKLEEVETPLQSRLPEQRITGFDPIFVISCGDSQDPEETYFISYIFNELCLHGFTPVRYDLTMMGNLEKLYSSCIGIMIVSMNYACSRECLDGFVGITDHFKANDLMLIPVFFKVSLSDVKNQSGSFEKALLQLSDSLQASQVQRWREAMLKLTSTNGYQYMKGHEVILFKDIVRDVCWMLSSETNGINLRLKRILPLLDCLQPSSPHIVGLWGMAGIGKTTLAKGIFRTEAERYDVCYFLPNFDLMCQTKGLSHLRDEFFSNIFGEENVFIDACDIKLSYLRDRFLDKRVLIVLDGVSNARDVEDLIGGFDWFSSGHTVILTSRNRQVLSQCNVKEIVELPNLSEYESLCLFGQSQTKNNSVASMTKNSILELVKYASGIPLALRVLGSSVLNIVIDNEKDHLRRLRQHPPMEIQDAFGKSYNGIRDSEKNIFLDLACFFRGENKDHVVNILDGCGFLTDLGIRGLIDESLISLVDNKIEIPNIFQDTGRFLVSQEHVEVGERSRLWDSDDTANVLISNSGTEAIEGIFLDTSGLTLELSPIVFERMYRLRLLKLHCPTSKNHCKICLPRGLDSLPDELRLLHWERYPLGSLPRNFNPKNLVDLIMPYSDITKLWKGTKNLERLKRIILSHSRQLTRFPRLSKAKNLEYIDLEGCTSLVKVNSSILHHQKLSFLSLKDCSHLRIMPTTIHLVSLEVLNLSGCSELEDLQDFSPNLKELYLAGTAIREMPSSLEDLTRLDTLDLENCERLQHLPPGIRNLKAIVTLKLCGCSNLKSHPNLDALFLRELRGPSYTEVITDESMPSDFHSAFQESRSDGSKILLNLENLKLRSYVYGSCFSRDVEKFLPAFEYLSTDEIPEKIWPRVSVLQFPSSILHSLASRLYALVSLYLCNAYLMDLPEEICRLSLVQTLDLSGNPFSHIPKSIKELCKLHSLRLRQCKNLRSLPELPRSLEILNAHGCVSLISFPSSFEKLLRHCTFSNCFALAPEVIRKSIEKALEGVGQEHSNTPSFSICIPASSGHEFLHTFQYGSSVSIVLNPDMQRTTSGFALSVVVEFRDNYSNAAGFGIKCICKNKAHLSYIPERIFYCWAPKEAPTIQKDHMFVFSVVKMHDFLADVVSFEFLPVDWENKHLDDSCRVKRCGVWKVPVPTYDTILGTKRPYSVEPSSVGQMSPSFKRCQLKRDTETVIPTLSKRKLETGVDVADRSLDERDKQRRVLINGRLKKLQEVVPNMGKRTNTADVLDAAVDYIEDLEREYKILKENRANCKCMNKEKKAM